MNLRISSSPIFIIIIFYFLIVTKFAHAQSFFHGQVLIGNFPIRGVKIFVVGKRYTATSDANGNYYIPWDCLNTNSDNYIIVRSAGFPTIIEKIDQQSVQIKSIEVHKSIFSLGLKGMNPSETQDISIQGSIKADPKIGNIVIGTDASSDIAEIQNSTNFNLKINRAPISSTLVDFVSAN